MPRDAEAINCKKQKKEKREIAQREKAEVDDDSARSERGVERRKKGRW